MLRTETCQINNEIASRKYQTVDSINWNEFFGGDANLFLSDEIFDTANNTLEEAPVQLDNRPGHTTYSLGNVSIHTKKPDPGEIFEPLNEMVAFECASCLGNYNTPTTIALLRDGAGNTTIGVASVVLCKDDLGKIDEDLCTDFFDFCDPTALIAESILGVFIGNIDWKAKHVILGESNTTMAGCYYYPIDRSHSFWGPGGDREIEPITENLTKTNFWYLTSMKHRMNEVLEIGYRLLVKLDNIKDVFFEDVSRKWTKKLTEYDSLNSKEYEKMAERMTKELITRKKTTFEEIAKCFSYSSWWIMS